MSRPFAYTAIDLIAAVNENSGYTTCPVCLSGVAPTSGHKEPYESNNPENLADLGPWTRVLLHIQEPSGQWYTTVVSEGH